ncbi:MAG: ABC transporter substrate-binding protein [Propionibacteriaceae bacterium]|jgi:NitT/TauT family transport system substrate-binding protein|nr:ABC transporter substrate-binding protein [Propionibacteriaceae bacterium]
MRSLRAATALVAGCLALSGLAGCADSSGSTPAGSGGPTELSLAIQPWLGYGAWYIAQDQGYFSANGLDVRLDDFEADADMVAALVAGRVDALNVAAHTALRLAQTEGVDIRIVLLEDASTTADAIITTGAINSVAELRGQEVAYEEGTTSDLLLNFALAQAGLSVDDIVKVPMGAAEAGAALLAGHVPAAVTYEPYITEAKAADPAVRSIFEASAQQGLISDVLVVRADVLEQKGAAVKALLKSWGQAVDFYNADLTQGRAIIARGVGEEPEALASAFDGVHFFDLSQNRVELTGDYVNRVLPQIAVAAQAAGLLDISDQSLDVVDPSYLD